MEQKQEMHISKPQATTYGIKILLPNVAKYDALSAPTSCCCFHCGFDCSEYTLCISDYKCGLCVHKEYCSFLDCKREHRSYTSCNASCKCCDCSTDEVIFVWAVQQCAQLWCCGGGGECGCKPTVCQCGQKCSFLDFRCDVCCGEFAPFGVACCGYFCTSDPREGGPTAGQGQVVVAP